MQNQYFGAVAPNLYCRSSSKSAAISKVSVSLIFSFYNYHSITAPPHTHMIPIKYLTHCIWEGSGKIALSWLRSLNPTQSCLNISVKQTSTWGKSFYSSKRFNLQIMTGPFWTSVHKQKRPFLENVQFLSFQLSNPLLYFISFFDYHQRIYEIPNTY